jgi:2,4-dienoyl-CoA reductase-like NADH-dependent reductase (Old Yellow Enzyme family)
MPSLFDPIKIKSIELKNRIFVSPMCQYSALDGVPQDWHLVHLGSRATGGAALVIAEATSVTPEGRISPGDTGLWNQQQQDAFLKITQYIKSQNSIPGIQIAHAGRKASCHIPWEGSGQLPLEKGGWKTVGPSPIPFNSKDRLPEELSLEQMKSISMTNPISGKHLIV